MKTCESQCENHLLTICGINVIIYALPTQIFFGEFAYVIMKGKGVRIENKKA